MKRVYLILFASTLPIFILVFGVTVVSAEYGDERVPPISTVGLSVETVHLGGTVMATVTFNDVGSLDNCTTVIDWGDGVVTPNMDDYKQDGTVAASGTHFYSEAGQYDVVVIVIMPDGNQTSASATLNVMTAQESIDVLIEHVDNLELGGAIAGALINQLEAAQVALDKEQTEAAVEALEAYLNELTVYIDAGLVPKEDPSQTIVEDMAYILLADPRPSPSES